MKPGILPTADGIRQLERKNRIRTAAGTMCDCSVCGRPFAAEQARVLFGRWPDGYVGGKLCSITCTERVLRPVAKAAKT